MVTETMGSWRSFTAPLPLPLIPLPPPYDPRRQLLKETATLYSDAPKKRFHSENDEFVAALVAGHLCVQAE